VVYKCGWLGNLYNNKIKELPSTINNLTSLNTLSLVSNEMSTLCELDKLINLTHLNIDYNPIKTLPTSLSLLPLKEF